MQKIALLKCCLCFIIMLSCLPAGGRTAVSTKIYQNGFYFNGTKFISFAELIVADGIIKAINLNPTNTTGTRIPLHGKFVIPGLCDAYARLSASPCKPFTASDPNYNAKSALQCGVTSIFDISAPQPVFNSVSESSGVALRPGATIYESGPVITVSGGYGSDFGVKARLVTDSYDAATAANDAIGSGAAAVVISFQDDGSALLPSLTIEMVKDIVKTAHAKNKKVLAHVDLASEATACAGVGVDGILKMPVDEFTEQQLNTIAKSGMFIIPALTSLQASLEGAGYSFLSDTLLTKTTYPAYLENVDIDNFTRPVITEKQRLIYHNSIRFRQNMEHCVAHKIPIVAGTDAGSFAVFFGYSMHQELQQYIRAGMTNADAINSASRNFSLIFPDKKIGQIAVGCAADLVVLTANPLVNIENTRRIAMVLHQGEPVSPAK